MTGSLSRRMLISPAAVVTVLMVYKMHQHKLDIISGSVFLFIDTQNITHWERLMKREITIYTAVCDSKEKILFVAGHVR